MRRGRLLVYPYHNDSYPIHRRFRRHDYRYIKKGWKYTIVNPRIGIYMLFYACLGMRIMFED